MKGNLFKFLGLEARKENYLEELTIGINYKDSY